MLENIVYALPELLLICGLITLPCLDFFKTYQKATLKSCIIFIILSALMEIIFYNKSFSSHYLNDTAFNTMMNLIVYACALSVLLLARRWYIATNESPLAFCEAVLLSLLFGNIMTASTHFAVTVISFWGMMSINFLLLKHSASLKENTSLVSNYGWPALFFGLLLLFSAFIFYIENGHLSYSSLSAFVSLNQDSPDIFYLMFAILSCFMFLFGFAPFHFWRTENFGQIILPVLAFFLLVPTGAYLCALINLCRYVFISQTENIQNFLLIFSAISMLIGALGVCSGKNIYKLLSYASLFHSSVMLLALNAFNSKAIDNSIFYFLTYLLAMFGIISAFSGLKSKGEYLIMLNDISGAAAKKPSISAMITIYLFSLIGFPPFLGFVGLYAVGYDLAVNNHLYMLVFLLAILVIMAYGYMQIIKSLYFEKSKNIFDTTERGIYALILINMILIVLISIEPDILIENIYAITEKLVD